MLARVVSSANHPATARLVDVAGKAGVSVAVASVALRGVSCGTIRVSRPTAERVRRVAREMRYRPNLAAQQLRGRKNDVIGVLIGADSHPTNYKRLAALEREAYGRGYRLMIGQFHGESSHTAEYIEDFLCRGIEALICFHNPLMPSEEEVVSLLRQARALVFQTQALVAGAGCVDADRAAGVRLAVGHLRGRGRRRIGLLLNCNPAEDPLMADRLKGYQAGLAGKRASRLEPLVWHGTGEYPPGRPLVDQAVESLVIERGCDGVVASNDVWAIELIKGLRRQGLDVPRDVAVVGFDNMEAGALFDPPLTSVDQNHADFARCAIDLLLEALEGHQRTPARRERIVQPSLVIRESA